MKYLLFLFFASGNLLFSQTIFINANDYNDSKNVTFGNPTGETDYGNYVIHNANPHIAQYQMVSYLFDVKLAGKYELWIKYAAGDATRKCRVNFARLEVIENTLSEYTGCWGMSCQTPFKITTKAHSLEIGTYEIIIEQPHMFPHISMIEVRYIP
ncbi:hypothetical protein DIS18_08750 [Algibacter marinivivus]|uniref:CBM6 domain-containing protein n=1 Tax=Algibacter marinivivus TaxID=2100723 RepID=A0A2U2X3H5_9FLAO|nr:hypothetical protein [Algibacter marinivivus]PWH82332.1 hypothetical protein DIS18_08750 [Algibacter marinivivus]